MTIFFYKIDAPYGCFSNFSSHPVECVGCWWATVEHYYQAQKFVGSPDEALIKLIQQAETPEQAAALGRDCHRQVRSDWEQVKKAVMWQGVLAKFLTHHDIQAILLATGEEIIVENSPTDYYWGCGQEGTGANELGKILMRVRAQIRLDISTQAQETSMNDRKRV
ncbi:MAG: NADAR family protein [Cyanophyceae cyanobacterium]